MSGLNDVAKATQLNPVECTHCKKRFPTTKVLNDFFKAIIKECSTGGSVCLSGFGTFRGRKFKGRTLKSPLLAGGEVTFPDSMVMRFHQSTTAKQRLNALAKGEGGEAKKPKAARVEAKKAKPKKVVKVVEPADDGETGEAGADE